MWDQLVVGAAPGDAITMCALGIKDALDRLGPTEVYSQFCEGDMAAIFRPTSPLEFASPSGNRAEAEFSSSRGVPIPLHARITISAAWNRSTPSAS